MHRRFCAIAICCLTMVGCGQPSTVITGANGEKIVVDHNGQNIRIQSAEGDVQVSGGSVSVSLPRSFPKDVPVCDGQVVLASQTGEGFHLMVDSSAKPESAYSFYAKKLPANGWKIENESRAADYISLIASKNGRTCSVVASRFDDDGANSTTVQVSVAPQD